jgi:TatD DNase family protein
VPFRGKPNQPIYVEKVAECVAELKGLTQQAVAEQTAENYFRCFPRVERQPE